MFGKFHSRGTVKRRGGSLPARLRFSAQRGVTLVELMIAMLILTLVCIAWLEIIGIQSARKEACRREAVERLAGMMDAFMYVKQGSKNSSLVGWHHVKNASGHMEMTDETTLAFEKNSATGDASAVYPVYKDDISPVGYQLRVVKRSEMSKMGLSIDDKWGNNSYWLVGLLYNHHGSEDVGNPFFTLSVCLGF